MFRCTHCGHVFMKREVIQICELNGVPVYSHGEQLNWDCYVKTLKQISEREADCVISK